MSPPADRLDLEDAFDEYWYLRNYPDIAGAVANGKHRSGWQHYTEHGRAEGRQPFDPRLVRLVEDANEQLHGRLFFVDEFLTCGDGALLTGWIDDRSDPLSRLVLQPYFGPAQDLLPRMARARRDDIAAMIKVSRDAHDFGFWVALDGLESGLPPVGARLAIGFASGRATELHLGANAVAGPDLRDRLLQVALWQSNWPAPPGEAGRLAGPLARALNRATLEASAAHPPLRFGAAGAAALSVVVPLPDDPATCLQQAPFLAGVAGGERAEIIYVQAGPGRAPGFETAVEAVHDLYGLPTVALRCPGTPGLPRARNAGAAVATGAALLFLDAWSLPQPDWLERALALAEAGAIIGATLLDGDEAVLSAGLSWGISEPGTGFWGAQGRLAGLPAALAPGGTQGVDAVTATAMLVPRAAFAALSGFDEDYILAGWDDLDLCMRARGQGVDVLVDAGFRAHYLPAGRRPLDEIERGAELVNAARFNELWGAALAGRA